MIGLSAGNRGYAMAALLVALSVMAVLLTMAIPVWRTVTKREKEAELVFRGSQYARAIALFQRKYANAFPPNLEILINERFLRKKYKDPMTKDGEFQLLSAANPGGSNAPGLTKPGTAKPLDQRPQVPAGAQGGITGVISKSTEPSLRLFNGRSKYNEWTFTPQSIGMIVAPPAGSSQRPGTAQPGRRPGDTKPGVGGPAGTRRLELGPRGIGPGGFGQPQPGQPQQPPPGRPPFGTRPPE